MTWWSLRKGLKTVHLWAGLTLSLPFVLLGLSGSILLLQPEIPRLSIPYSPTPGEPRPIEKILSVARNAAPPDLVISRIAMPQRKGEPAALRFTTPDRVFRNAGGTLIYVDPVSLKILGSGEQVRPAPIFQFARQLHAALFVDTMSGRRIVGWLGFAWTFLMLSGLVLWWPRRSTWRSAFTIKRGAHGWKFNRDLHRAFGFWTALLLLVIGISGIDLAYPRAFRRAVENILPVGQIFTDGDVGADSDSLRPSLDLDQAVALAKTKVSDADAAIIQPALHRGDIVVLTLTPRSYGVGGPAVLVTIDPAAGRVTSIDDPRLYAVGERLLVWQRQLHAGLGLGIIYRVLVFAAGLLPLLFAITGVRMWWITRARRRFAPRETVPVLAG